MKLKPKEALIMRRQWKILEEHLKKNNPALLADLAPPATNAEINELEAIFEASLPSDFVECLKIHNGQNGEADWLFPGSEFLSSKRIFEEWKIWHELLDGGDFEGAKSEPGPGIRPVWWTPKWIPFTYNGAGDHLCLDLDPAPGGETGQIITLWHDDGIRTRKADSFSEWFFKFIKLTT